MITKNGVCYDLSVSPYVFYIRGFELHFSSGSHLDKFKQTWQMKIDWLNDSLSRRFHFDLIFDDLAILNTYRQIETRGFYVIYGGKVYTCPGNIKLYGGIKGNALA